MFNEPIRFEEIIFFIINLSTDPSYLTKLRFVSNNTTIDQKKKKVMFL